MAARYTQTYISIIQYTVIVPESLILQVAETKFQLT